MRCTRCKQDKDEHDFAWRNRAAGKRFNVCRACKRDYDSGRAAARRATDRAARLNLQRRVFDLLGSTCACCGEDNLLFLTLDHRESDGYKDRTKSRDGRSAYRQALVTPERFQILCFNCNSGRARNFGICPHVA